MKQGSLITLVTLLLVFNITGRGYAYDFDRDSDVDGLDLSQFSICYDSGEACADSNGDACVDTLDLALFAEKYGSLCYNVSGTIMHDGMGLENVSVTLHGDVIMNTSTTSDGGYSFECVKQGDYLLFTSKSGFRFDPESQEISVSQADIQDMNFEAHVTDASWLWVFPETTDRLTLDQALGQAEAGDTIILVPGDYNPSDRLTTAESGQPGMPITIKAANPHTAVIRGNGNVFGFKIIDRAYIEIQGLSISGYREGCGVKLIACHHITLRNLVISDCQSHNISIIDNSYSNTVENCEVSASQAIGIHVAATNGTVEAVHDNLIHGNESHHNGQSGILLYGDDNFITQNISHHNGTRDPYDHGIYCVGNANLVEGNMCTDNPCGSGIRLGDRDHVVRDNICRRNGWSGVLVGGTNDSHNILIEWNELEENGHSGIKINAVDYHPSGIDVVGNLMKKNPHNFFIMNGVTAVTVTDNIFTDPNDYQIFIDMDQSVAEQEFIFSGNEFFGPVCDFYIGGHSVSAEDFLAVAQPGTSCSPTPYE